MCDLEALFDFEHRQNGLEAFVSICQKKFEVVVLCFSFEKVWEVSKTVSKHL